MCVGGTYQCRGEPHKQDLDDRRATAGGVSAYFEKVTVASRRRRERRRTAALFLALHRHHRSVTDLPLVADDEAWGARPATYLAWFAEGRALLFVAREEETPVGYALVVWHEGGDDTFPLAPRYAGLYTLRWQSRARGAGVGARLFDAVDEALADEGDPPLVIAVMAGNTDALRFYARRGLVPGELPSTDSVPLESIRECRTTRRPESSERVRVWFGRGQTGHAT